MFNQFSKFSIYNRNSVWYTAFDTDSYHGYRLSSGNFVNLINNQVHKRKAIIMTIASMGDSRIGRGWKFMN